jgi:cysteine desulfurase/selenocysteine lyase
MAASALAAARALFPHTGRGEVYLNHAATGPLSTRVVDAVRTHLRERSEGSLETFPLDAPMVSDCRVLAQRLIGAESPDRIALTTNTSDGVSIVASGVPWRSGDRVLLSNLEFPANVWPYRHMRSRGVEVDVLESADGRVTPGMIEDALTPRTRVVALSAVQFLSGFRADLAAIGELCRARSIVFAVDGIQAVGAIEIDVQAMKIDALAAGGQKWLLAPHGSGFLYVTEALQSMISQPMLGWLGVADPWRFSDYEQGLAPTARRYEGGSLNIPSLWGLHASLSTLLEFRAEAIEAQIAAITGDLIERLRSVGGVSLYTPDAPGERAGIVTIRCPAGIDPQHAFKALRRQRVTVAVREGMLRYSPHFYNSPADIEQAAEATRVCFASLAAQSSR